MSPARLAELISAALALGARLPDHTEPASSVMQAMAREYLELAAEIIRLADRERLREDLRDLATDRPAMDAWLACLPPVG